MKKSYLCTKSNCFQDLSVMQCDENELLNTSKNKANNNETEETPEQVIKTSDDGLQLQLEQNKLINGIIQETFKDSLFSSEFNSTIQNGIFKYAKSLSEPMSNTIPLKEDPSFRGTESKKEASESGSDAE